MSDDTDLDRLERLNRLRESGALTDDEFAAKKQEILSTGSQAKAGLPRWVPWGIGLAVLAAALVGAAIWSPYDEPEPSATAEAAPATITPTMPVVPSPTPTPEESQPSAAELLAFATSERVIGMTPAFIEQRLGTPTEKQPTSLVYDIGGCTITYWSDDDRVTTFFFDIDRSCRVRVRGVRIGPDTSFGDILRQSSWGALTADCLDNCGNAADPTIDLRYNATRATSDIGINFSSDYDQSSEALDLWEQAVRRDLGFGEYESTSGSDAFGCATNPPGDVRRLATQLKVKTVWVVEGEFGGC